MLLGAVGVAALRWWGLILVAVLVAFAVAHAVLWARRTSFALTDDGLLYRTGVLTRQTTATFFDKLQVVSLRRSPFDRRHRMATLTVDTAANGQAPIQIPYVEEEVAADLFRTLSAQAEITALRW